MGNDGGTIARRQDIKSLHSYSDAAENKLDFHELRDLLTVCGLLGVDLKDCPIVSDYKGHLYSKEKILEYILDLKTNDPSLLSKASYPTRLSHIKLINDVVTVIGTWRNNHLACPVTSESESVTLAYSRRCGCLVISKLLKEFLQLEISACPVCSMTYDPEIDPVFINVNDNPELRELNQATYEILQTRGLHHNKKLKKSSKKLAKPKITNAEPETLGGAESTKRDYKDITGNKSPDSVERMQLLASALSTKRRKV